MSMRANLCAPLYRSTVNYAILIRTFLIAFISRFHARVYVHIQSNARAFMHGPMSQIVSFKWRRVKWSTHARTHTPEECESESTAGAHRIAYKSNRPDVNNFIFLFLFFLYLRSARYSWAVIVVSYEFHETFSKTMESPNAATYYFMQMNWVDLLNGWFRIAQNQNCRFTTLNEQKIQKKPRNVCQSLFFSIFFFFLVFVYQETKCSQLWPE